MEMFNSVLKYILKSKTRLLDLRVCSPFCSITFRCRFLRAKLSRLPLEFVQTTKLFVIWVFFFLYFVIFFI